MTALFELAVTPASMAPEEGDRNDAAVRMADRLGPLTDRQRGHPVPAAARAPVRYRGEDRLRRASV